MRVNTLDGLFYRIFGGLVIAFVIYVAVYRHEEFEQAPETIPKRQRYLPLLNSQILMSFLLLMVPSIFFAQNDNGEILHTLVSIWFTIFSHICVFYMLLAAILPFLRKKISARVCATLWLLPNYLYLIISNRFYASARPLIVLRSPVWLTQALMVIWVAGFVVVFVWKIIEHIRFRKQILAAAQPVTDPDILALWEQEQQMAGFKKRRYSLVLSPAVKTPLTLGFSSRSTRVVLPERNYSMEELVLILRHEIIHLGRDDCGTKLFLTFCTALCWINPLMWIAMRRSAEDLELSCDESVLREADEHTRRRYAELLLTTAGDDRGFTSSLSNSAKSLRYRLRQVMHPREKLTGAMVLAVTFFVLFTTCGFISVTYATETGQDAIFQNYDFEDCTLQSAVQYGTYTYFGETTHKTLASRRLTCPEPIAMNQYLSGLQLNKLTGEYQFSDNAENTLRLVYDLPDYGHLFLQLRKDLVVVEVLENNKLRTYAYVPQEPINYEFLLSQLIPE